MAITKEQIRQIISGNDINSVSDVYTLLRDGFKDILQELWGQNWMLPSVMGKTRKGTCRQDPSAGQRAG